jgi:nucleoside 2-deoxyribosyltransferase
MQKIKIYFAGAISAGRELQPLYRAMVDYLQEHGAEVLSAHVARADVLTGESKLTDEQIFRRNLDFIVRCDGMVAEVTTPSLGVGFEISEALQRRKPVICLCKKGTFLTRMLTGNRDQNLTIRFYEPLQEWQQALEDFLNKLRLAGSFRRS